MAMFEQMRANVGKLLKGIDRSEPGRRERVWPGGVEERISGDDRGGQDPGFAQGGTSQSSCGRCLSQQHCESLEAGDSLAYHPAPLFSFRPLSAPEFPLCSSASHCASQYLVHLSLLSPSCHSFNIYSLKSVSAEQCWGPRGDQDSRRPCFHGVLSSESTRHRQ